MIADNQMNSAVQQAEYLAHPLNRSEHENPDAKNLGRIVADDFIPFRHHVLVHLLNGPERTRAVGNDISVRPVGIADVQRLIHRLAHSVHYYYSNLRTGSGSAAFVSDGESVVRVRAGGAAPYPVRNPYPLAVYRSVGHNRAVTRRILHMTQLIELRITVRAYHLRLLAVRTRVRRPGVRNPHIAWSSIVYPILSVGSTVQSYRFPARHSPISRRQTSCSGQSPL